MLVRSTNVFHEFKTPLTLILASVERLLKSSSLLSEDQKSKMYVRMYKNAEGMLRLINELMDFRKLESGSLKLKKQNSDLVSFICNIYSGSLELDPKSMVTNSMEESFLNKAITVVEENLDNTDLNIEKFCLEMGMGKTSLHNKLKALTGKSTGEFIRSIRLTHAARLLKKRKLNVSEVCYMVGFNTVWYFSKCFKKEFNVSPSNYFLSSSDVEIARMHTHAFGQLLYINGQ